MNYLDRMPRRIGSQRGKLDGYDFWKIAKTTLQVAVASAALWLGGVISGMGFWGSVAGVLLIKIGEKLSLDTRQETRRIRNT